MIRRFSRPYARAIMDVAGSPQHATGVLADLRKFELARRSSGDLQELFANPGIDADAKIAISKKISARLGLEPMAIRVLEILIRNHRANDLDSINAALSALINSALGVAVAEVSAAHDLSSDEVQHLRQTLERKIGKKVEVEITTDPALLGGFVAKIGSEIYNASVAGKIAKFRASLE